MHLHEFLDEHIHFFIGKHLQPDNWRQHILDRVGREPALRQPGAQRLIAEHALILILYALRGSADQKADVLRLALQNVVIYGKNFFIVALAGG